MTPLEIGALVGITFVGALVQGVVGIGYAIVTAPVLVGLDVDLVPGPVLFGGLVLSVMMAVRDRRGLHLRGAGTLVASRVPGTVIGALAVAALSTTALKLVLGGVVLAGVVATATRWHVSPTTGHLVAAGFVSGITATATSIGGPPMALVYQHEPGERLRGTLSLVFVIGSALSVAVLAAVGEYGGRELRLSTLVVPGVVLGALASTAAGRRLPSTSVRAGVLAVSAVAAATLVVGELL